MNRSDLDVTLENESLRTEFKALGLDLVQVWHPPPDNPELENAQLLHLLDWVRAYKYCPNRRELEQKGYDFPPVEPGIDPDTDWLRFERWMKGEAVSWNFCEEYRALRDPSSLSDEEVEAELEFVTELLGQRSVVIDVYEGVPPRLLYNYLRKELETSHFEITVPDCFCHIGCSAYCPGCFQRPWCEVGQEQTWPEDEEAGQMVVPLETEIERKRTKGG